MKVALGSSPLIAAIITKYGISFGATEVVVRQEVLVLQSLKHVGNLCGTKSHGSRAKESLAGFEKTAANRRPNSNSWP